MKKKIVFFSMVSLLAFPLLFGSHTDAKPFYEGKIMKLIVATTPGGGYDFYGRLMAKFMEKYLPGSTIIIKNVPGAGHIIGTNELYYAKPNGLTFGTFNRALPLGQVAGLEGIKFDLSKMSWLGSPTTEEYSLIVSTKTPWRSLEDVLKAEKVLLSSAGVGSISHVIPMLFAEMVGVMNVKLVTGYSGGEAELAMMRGEIQGQWGSWASLRGFVEDGHGVPVIFITQKPIKGYENVPLLQNVVTEEKHKPVVELMLAINVLGRPFAGPPDIPQDRLKVLQEAFRKACSDPELLKIAKKAKKPMEFISGDEALSLVENLMSLPPEVLKSIKEAYGIK
jgi:tripartite-type tricarboxylate transporter receptor subunit TctC